MEGVSIEVWTLVVQISLPGERGECAVSVSLPVGPLPGSVAVPLS